MSEFSLPHATFDLIVLSLGSNLGDRQLNLDCTAQRLTDIGIEILKRSRSICTAPYGFESENDFLNEVIVARTSLAPLDLLEATQAIEIELGRTHKSINGMHFDRTIDIDIIDYKGIVYRDEQLTLPHPEAHKRDFVILPLAEVWPEYIHPIIHKTAAELARSFA